MHIWQIYHGELDSKGHTQLKSHLVKITPENPCHPQQWQDAHALREIGTKNTGRNIKREPIQLHIHCTAYDG